MVAVEEPRRIAVEFTEQQLELVDLLAAEWGLSRGQVVARGLQEFANQELHLEFGRSSKPAGETARERK